MVVNARIDVVDLSVWFPLVSWQFAQPEKDGGRGGNVGRLGHDRAQHVVVRALRDINLQLTAGARLGLIGSNGAGKTTLLRVLAGIYEPVSGSLRVQGSLNALLDPSLGMNPDLTGRENILLRGLYAGLPKPALPRLEDDVTAFAELSDFIDLPVRIYSAGMVVRLGFALATAIKPQILLMDEWFLAGDAGRSSKRRGCGWRRWCAAPTSWCCPPTRRRSSGPGARVCSGWTRGKCAADGPWPTQCWRTAYLGNCRADPRTTGGAGPPKHVDIRPGGLQLLNWRARA